MFQRVRSAVVALAVLGAVAAGASAIAGAASNSGTTGSQGSGTTGSQGSGAAAPRTDPAALKHGPGETLLTDGDATKVKQAALDKVPGATVLRVETDAQGSAFEAHLRKSDGSEVTVKVNKQFEATDVENGFGAGGPPGAHP